MKKKYSKLMALSSMFLLSSCSFLNGGTKIVNKIYESNVNQEDITYERVSGDPSRQNGVNTYNRGEYAEIIINIQIGYSSIFPEICRIDKTDNHLDIYMVTLLETKAGENVSTVCQDWDITIKTTIDFVIDVTSAEIIGIYASQIKK